LGADQQAQFRGDRRKGREKCRQEGKLGAGFAEGIVRGNNQGKIATVTANP